MDSIKVMLVGSEVTPFAKVGGLGDVLGALPKALYRAGFDARVVMPLYRDVPRETLQRLPFPLGVPVGGREYWCGVHESRLPGSDVPVYFFEYEELFNRSGVYRGDGDEHLRYAVLSRGALQLTRMLGWLPDVIHCNDWQTGVIPGYLNTVEAGTELGSAASVMTIHNLAFQGEFGSDIMPEIGLPWELFHDHGYRHHDHVNLLKGGLFNSTLNTTVSPTYAHQIQGKSLGMGLDWVLRMRSNALFGVLNGIDAEVWNPDDDPHTAAAFGPDDLSGKAICKRALQREYGLPERDVPLIGLVSRLVPQKGIDIIAEALPRILDLDIQLVILGRGVSWVEETLPRYAAAWPHQLGVHLDYNEGLAHRIEAGSDFFLMPSRFEPCGLNQMYSMRYGTLPIVRATGGLDDTVINYRADIDQGTGFKLQDLTAQALRDTIHWAVSLWWEHPEAIERMRVRAMEQDFSWDRAAQNYARLYRLAIAHRR